MPDLRPMVPVHDQLNRIIKVGDFYITEYNHWKILFYQVTGFSKAGWLRVKGEGYYGQTLVDTCVRTPTGGMVANELINSPGIQEVADKIQKATGIPYNNTDYEIYNPNNGVTTKSSGKVEQKSEEFQEVTGL